MIKVAPLHRLNFWHFLAYQLDKRLYQYAINPFDPIDVTHLKLEGATFINDISEIDFIECIITTLDHIQIDEDWLSKSRNAVIQWRIPKYEIQNAYLLNRVKVKVSFSFFSDSTSKINHWYKLISLENGIVNAYEKYAWYSSLILKNVLLYQAKSMGEFELNIPTSRRYFKIFKLYFRNFLFLLNRKFKKDVKNWKIAYLNKIDGSIQFIKQPLGSFWADPFPIVHANKQYVFFEEMNFRTQLGEIAYLELDQQHNILQKQTVLKNNTHFSFPNVFEYEGAHYMLPENVQSNQLMLYKAYDFPNDWRPFKVLMDNIKLLDPIWFYHEGYYWIMGSKIHEFESDNNNALYLFYSNDLFSTDWTSHPMNPVVSDSQFARNAGRVIFQNNRIYRVAQNCTMSYGENLSIILIEIITTANYSEVPVSLKQAPLGYKGMHTFNIHNKIVWVDVLKKE